MFRELYFVRTQFAYSVTVMQIVLVKRPNIRYSVIAEVWRTCLRGTRLPRSRDREPQSLLLRSPRARFRAFTLVDIMAAIAVIAVLIGILLPSLSGVREATRQVVCRSNVRQLGIGVATYADDNQDVMPPSIYAPVSGVTQPQRTTLVRRDVAPNSWDGLGILFDRDYLGASGVFYCPSHTGQHPFSRYVNLWDDPSVTTTGEIISNFQYRGYSLGVTKLSLIQIIRPTPALISDGLRTRDEYNHRVGANVLRGDLSVFWFKDPGGSLVAEDLPVAENDSEAPRKIITAWGRLDCPQPIQ